MNFRRISMARAVQKFAERVDMLQDENLVAKNRLRYSRERVLSKAHRKYTSTTDLQPFRAERSRSSRPRAPRRRPPRGASARKPRSGSQLCLERSKDHLSLLSLLSTDFVCLQIYETLSEKKSRFFELVKNLQ